MTISARARNAFRRALSPSPSGADEVCDGVDALRSPAGTNLGDAAVTIQRSQGAWRKLPAATLTANRIITLGTTAAVAGDQIEITRYDLTAFTLAFLNGGVGGGTLYTMVASKLGCAKFQFDGTNWALRSFGDQT